MRRASGLVGKALPGTEGKMLSKLQLREEDLREQKPESHPGAVRFLHPFSVPDSSSESPAVTAFPASFCQIQGLHLIEPVSCICTANHSLRIVHSPGVLSASLRPLLFCCFSSSFVCLFSFSSSLFSDSFLLLFFLLALCVGVFQDFVLGFFSSYPIPLVTCNLALNAAFQCISATKTGHLLPL